MQAIREIVSRNIFVNFDIPKEFGDRFEMILVPMDENISNEQINSIQLLMPTNQLIENFNSQLKSSYDKILNNQNENQQLSSLRDWLLPMLMNGQVKVE